MNRGEGTPPATKSGRKVKRPAHFDDSPETASPGKVKKEVAPESVKKTARRTLALAGTPPSAKNGSDSESGEVALGKKSARKTLAKNGSREESPEPEVKKAAPASARKTLLKSAVQNSSAEAGTPKKTPAKKADPEPDVSEAGPGLSRTGRKIKVPAHLKEFEDVVVPAVTGRKSVAPKKDEPEAVPKSATKAKTIVRQLATEHEEEKPEPKTPAKAKQARKAAEEEVEETKPVTKTPGRARSVARKTAEEEEDSKPAPRARGRSVARKASVDEPAPFEEKPTPKTYGRARSVARQTEDEDKPKSPVKSVEAPKTPGRTKSAPRRFADADEEEVPKPAPKTPGRAKSMAARKPSVDEPAQPAKTPSRRAKSIAPQSKPDEEADPLALPDEPPKPESPPKKQPTKTPSKARAKSIARDPSPEPSQKSDPSEPAPTSRSGRKIKPKKYFGEFEQDESVPAVVPVATAKVITAASPVKSPKVIVASPVRSPQQQVVKKGSPYAPKKDLPAAAAATPVTKTTSPVKRLSVPEKKSPAVVVPTKKAKKDAADGDDGSPFKISPATEERQITKRNVNDHHHHQKQQQQSPKVVGPSSPAAGKSVSPPKKAKLVESPKIIPSEPELVPEQDPLASSSSGSLTTATTASSSSSVTTTESSEVTTPPAPPKEVEDKPKRGRKTLPAASASEDTVDVQKTKTPGRKTMAPAMPLEEPGSSRSGRKIKPKKFFDDGEPEPAVKAKPEVATPAGRGGKRKTIVVPREEKEEGEDEEVEEKKKEEDKKEEPMESVSREEIMAIVGGFGEVAEPVEADADAAAAAPAEAEPMNGTATEEKLDTVATDVPTTTPDDDTTAAEADQPAAAAAADSTEEPATAEPEPQDPPTTHDEVAEASSGNFPETPIEQTPPLASTTEQTETTSEPTTAPTVPDDPAPSVEAEPAPAEQSASSAFSEALLVEEESTAAAAEVDSADVGPTVEEKMEELFESVEFLEESSARLSDVTAAAAAVADGVSAEVLEQELGEVMGEEAVAPVEEPVQGDETEDLDKTEQPSAMDEPTLESVQQEEEEDLNKTEPPAALNETAEEVGQNQEEELLATSMPDEVDEFFAENDRSQESITVLPETPKQKPGLEQEDLDLIGKLPEPQQSSSNTVAFVEIPTPATPKTPESKPAIGKDDYSPDKPDAQEQASEPHELQKQQAPPEIIEIFDSPVVATAIEPANQDSTSTPVGPSSSKLTVKERLIQNSRKRSLSASDADLSTKKNVTFHSPANSTILVDTLDERLKKSLKADSKSKAGRKRSLSEHKETDPAGPKPSKISKLPNFKNIHQNQFNRMESIAEYHNRKVQRAKEILTNSASKSPAKSTLVRGATPQKSTPHSAQKNGSSVATQLKFSSGLKPPSSHTATATSSSAATTSASAATTSVKPLLSDEARQEKRQQQFKAAFKPKTAAALDSGKSHQDSPDGARRVVEQSRHKQHQILKGVRTNKRFELLMKFRDAAQD